MQALMPGTGLKASDSFGLDLETGIQPTTVRHDFSCREKLFLGIQRVLGRVSVLTLGVAIVALLRLRGRYKIAGHKEIRRRFYEITRSRRPLVICANHLTLIDSVIILWALASLPRYAMEYRLFSWNLPAVENTRKRLSWLIVTFLNKCILVDRLGEAGHTSAVIDRVTSLLRRGDIVTVFPEGTRSRSGRIDPSAATYGIGKILQQIPDCRVLCVYLRGRGQTTFSDFPRKGEIFDLDMAIIRTTTSQSGLRAVKERSLQVIDKLQDMEAQHFARHE